MLWFNKRMGAFLRQYSGERINIMKQKLHSRILAAALSFVLVISLLPTTVFAASPEGVWTDYAASDFNGGTGTESDPYQIANAEQLAKLSKDVGDGTSYQETFFILTENIDLSAHRWVPIGLYKWPSSGTTVNKSFQGFLDGNDKTISGMYVDERTDHYCGGLFGKITIQQNGSPVGAKDLTITGATVYVYETGLQECYGAILAGNVLGSSTQSIVFENITVSGSVHVTRTNGSNNIGGMLGYASWVKATNCHADGVSISGASNSGGFVGNDSGSVYENCTASGTIDGAWSLGGFVGYSTSAKWQDATGASTYTKCAADVDVSGNDWRIGGFVGYAEYGKFENCVAYGDVTSSVTGWESKVGGFMGEDNSDVNATDCHAAGTVTGVSSDYQAGGFIGTYSGGTFTGCSFDSEKNPDLNAAGEETIAAGVTGEESAVVLSNICEDYYGGHQYSAEWTVETAATCTEAGSKYHPCERCRAKGDITAIPAIGHKYGEPVWSWSEDGKSCTATFICENDKTHQETPEVTVTSEVKTPATSTQNGVTEYTATTTFDGKTYTDTKDVADIPATGGSSSGSPTYAITVKDTDNGTVICYAHGAAEDAVVTLHVKADVGYQLASLTVTDADGSTRAVTKVDEKTYTFVMPACAVTVEAVFAPTSVEPSDLPVTAVSPSDWFYDAVKFVYENGLMDGVEGNLFAPNATLNRAMAVTILYRLEGSPDLDGENLGYPFADVDGNAWYSDAVYWARRNGIVDGVENNHFDPTGSLTREQMATVLYRYAQYKGADVSASGDLSGFADSANVSSWAADAVKWAVGTGLVNGVEGNALAPQGTSTRAQAATVLMRFVG